MTTDYNFNEYSKIGNARYSAKKKQDNRRRIGKKVSIAGLRTIENDDEMFAIVTKLCGNGMCEVKTNDNIVRLCIIRKKFSGRQKRRNQVSIGTTILIGLRDWERNENSRLPKCDLLEVYTESEIRKLKQRGAINIENISQTSIYDYDYDDIEFETADKSNIYKQFENLNIDVGQQPNRNYDLTFSSEDDSQQDEDIDINDI